MTFETILYEKEGQILTITLNRPEAANALNLQMAEDLFEASLRCAEDNEIGSSLFFSNSKDANKKGRNSFLFQPDEDFIRFLDQMETLLA